MKWFFFKVGIDFTKQVFRNQLLRMKFEVANLFFFFNFMMKYSRR
eukprot:UN14038